VLTKKQTKKVFGAIALASLGAVSQAAQFEDWARVVSSQPQYEQGPRRQVCNGSSSNSPGVGTVIGAVAGGLIGSQVGRGNGRVAATAGGAVVGALSGNHNENKDGNCYMEETGGRLIGYAVSYEYNGRVFTDTFATPPNGESIRIRVSVGPRWARQ